MATVAADCSPRAAHTVSLDAACQGSHWPEFGLCANDKAWASAAEVVFLALSSCHCLQGARAKVI